MRVTLSIISNMNFNLFNEKLSLHIPCVNPSVIFNIYNLENYNNFNYIHNKIENDIVENIIIDFIKKQFKYQKIGCVNRVDIIPKFTNYGTIYYSAFCHFDYWFYNYITISIQNKLYQNKKYNNVLFYEKNSYWILNNNINPLDEESAKLHRIINDQQNIIMSIFKYKPEDFKYKYKYNMNFINPINKNKQCLYSIISNQQQFIKMFY